MNSCERMQILDAVGMYITFSWVSCLKSWLLLPVKKCSEYKVNSQLCISVADPGRGARVLDLPTHLVRFVGLLLLLVWHPNSWKPRWLAGWLIVLSGAEGASVSWEVMLTLLPKILQSKWKGKREGCVWWRTKMQTV